MSVATGIAAAGGAAAAVAAGGSACAWLSGAPVGCSLAVPLESLAWVSIDGAVAAGCSAAAVADPVVVDPVVEEVVEVSAVVSLEVLCSALGPQAIAIVRSSAVRTTTRA